MLRFALAGRMNAVTLQNEPVFFRTRIRRTGSFPAYFLMHRHALKRRGDDIEPMSLR